MDAKEAEAQPCASVLSVFERLCNVQETKARWIALRHLIFIPKRGSCYESTQAF
jgi:hypothetical protein